MIIYNNSSSGGLIYYSAQSIVIDVTPEERAELLLRRHLTPEQKASWTAHGYFDTIGKSGARYRILHRGARQYNVVRLRGGQCDYGYCAYPRLSSYLPMADVILAQKLAIETHDRWFRFIACSVRIRNGCLTSQRLPWFLRIVLGVFLCMVWLSLARRFVHGH